jgi:hypothetical protein
MGSEVFPDTSSTLQKFEDTQRSCRSLFLSQRFNPSTHEIEVEVKGVKATTMIITTVYRMYSS